MINPYEPNIDRIDTDELYHRQREEQLRQEQDRLRQQEDERRRKQDEERQRQCHRP